jgi:uncharacterized membrane protein (UPF0182 family)
LTSPASSRSARRSPRLPVLVTVAILAALVIAFFIFSSLLTDFLWFKQLGFANVLTTQWIASAVMFFIGFLAMAVPVYISIDIAFRFRPVYAKLNSQLDRYQQVIEPLRRVVVLGVPIVLGLFAGIASSTSWQVALQWLNRTPFGTTDPKFGLDVGFYVFSLPFYQGVVGFASAVVLISGLAAVATSYLYGALRFTGREVRISKVARIQLAITAAVYLLLQGISLWLDQYATLTDGANKLLTGVTYADDAAGIPGKQILALAAAIVAVLFIVTAIIGRWRLPVIGTAALIIASIIVGGIYPWIVQRFQVEPSERTVEAPFIENNIDATREAYGVSDVEEETYDAQSDAEAGALAGDAVTTANIRIIDPALVTDAFAQLQQYRQYYSFPEQLSVDRYTIDGNTQDTVIAVRELNTDQLGASATPYNTTFVYTHGYGVVAAYGNQRSADGQPVFLESGIPVTGALGDTDEYEPRIYFGQESPAYSIVGGDGENDIELDYPSGSNDNGTNQTTTFEGDGGPTLDNPFKKLIYAIKFQSEQIFLSDAVNDESQILYDRDPSERVQKVAPYLTIDSAPYPAVVDGKVVWIVDGYTTTRNYPYSKPQALSDAIADTYTERPTYASNEINYIRNSVKATVDAYDGSVNLYAWDTEDPMLKTWQKIFPSTLTPLSEMSVDLMEHVRYPQDMFKVQRAILGTYHVTDSDSFYSSDDAWVTPNEPTSTATTPPLQPPYYLTLQLPDKDPAFSIYSTYIPQQSGENARNVLTGYLAANADAGSTPGEVADSYGDLTLLTLPRTDTLPGPGQVQNNFNTDTAVANQLALLTRGDTSVVRGNLLTLPVGGGLLYVQPIYVKSTSETSYPVLQRILVSFGDQIAFEDTLDGALDELFGGNSGATAGDNGVPTTDPATDGDGAGEGDGAAEGGDTGTTDPGTTDPGTGSGTDNAALDQALADAQSALDDRAAAYADNDLVEAAEADARLQTALEDAVAASGE